MKTTHSVERLRLAAWNLKKVARTRLGTLLPRWTVRGESTELLGVPEAWPPVRLVFPEPHVFRPPPGLRPLFDSNPIYAGRPIVLAPVALYEIPNGILAPRSGLIASRDGRWIRESCKDAVSMKHYEGFESPRGPVERLDVSGWVSTIMNGAQQVSFGHWLLDALPRLHALGVLGAPVRLLTPAGLRPTYRRMLELVCPENVELVETKATRLLRVERLLLTPCVTLGGCGLIRPEVLESMRQSAVERSRAKPAGLKRIYISREATRWSRVENESAVIEAMRQLGVTSVVTERLSADEQVALLAGAELVVAPLGSGLANLIFARPGTTVVEIFAGGPGRGQRPHLYNAALAAGAGHNYVPVFHENASSEPSYRVDVDRIVASVQTARPGGS